MTQRIPFRLLLDSARPGPWNMAVDQLLLEEAAQQGVASLRCYRWEQPTLSLGYFQEYKQRESHSTSRAAAVVRRQSGGGAILHDRELTYCLTLPSAHPATVEPTHIYNRVHNVLLQILQELVADAHQLALCAQKSDSRPFLCFQRRSIGDIVYLAAGEKSSGSVGYKVVGSAQRRWRGAVLQHGSILLSASPAAPELPGLAELTDCKLDIACLQNQLIERVATAFDLNEQAAAESELRDWCEQNVSRIEGLRKDRYGNRIWTERR